MPEGLSWEEENEHYRNNASFVKIYATDPDFIATYGPAMLYGYYSGWNERYYLGGGHLLNPSTLTTHYRTSSGVELAPSSTAVSSNSDVVDYQLSQFIDWTNPSSPVLDQSKIDTLYGIGDELPLTPPTIPGYITPAPQTLTLSQSTNEHTFIYKPAVTEVSFGSNEVINEEKVVATPSVNIPSSIITQSNLKMTASTCSHLTSARLLAPNEITVSNSPSEVTILGGLEFSIACNNDGEAEVNYTLGNKVPDNSKLRIYKYNSITQEMTDITAQVTISTIDNKTVINYSLLDGGELDEDGTANGIIIDPVVIGYMGTLDDLDQAGGLAETGVNQELALLTGMILSATGMALLVKIRRD